LTDAAWQRCYVHFLRNALDDLPRKADDDCLQGLRRLYDRRDLAEAQRDLAAWLTKWSTKYPKLTDWVEDPIGETLTFDRLPRAHHKHLKSTNMLERRSRSAPGWCGSSPIPSSACVWCGLSVSRPMRTGLRTIATSTWIS
jgi:transposase-like protein